MGLRLAVLPDTNDLRPWTKRLRRGSGERFFSVLAVCVEQSLMGRVILVSFRPLRVAAGVHFS